jgi:hypothetical protein
MKRVTLSLALALSLAGCSSIMDGSTQEVAITTNPPGADCALIREGKAIARVNPTPGTVSIARTKHDISIECSKPGYARTVYANKSSTSGAPVGNVVVASTLGWVMDSAADSDKRYQSNVLISLQSLHTGMSSMDSVEAAAGRDAARR